MTVKRRVSLEARKVEWKGRDSKSRLRLAKSSTDSYGLYRRLYRASRGATVPESATGSGVTYICGGNQERDERRP
jgi:hypothetical protein